MSLRTYIPVQGLIGAALERCRSQAGLDQGEMAKAMMMSPANLSRLERGHGNLTVEQLFIACEILAVQPDAFVAAVQQARQELLAAGHIVHMMRSFEDNRTTSRGYVEIAVETLRAIVEPLVRFNASMAVKPVDRE